MRLIECYIENFGGISERQFKFSDGLNCLIGENGAGKTTLSVFIKAMLYGIGDTKKASIDENDRKHYLPWSGARAGGTLTFFARGRSYRIERYFGKKAADDTFALYDLKLGRPSNDFGEQVGEELFGIDCDGFERTVFLSERNLSPKSENKSISAKLSDLAMVDGDIGVLDDALKVLDDQRKFYRLRGDKGEIANTRAEISRREDELLRLDRLEERATETKRRIEEIRMGEREAIEEQGRLSRMKEDAARREAARGYEEHIKKMRSESEELTARKGALLEFFGGDVPSFETIDEYSFKDKESKRLLSGGGEDAESAEYNALSGYFFGKCTDEEIEEIRIALAKEEQRRASPIDPRQKRKKELFKKRTPKKEELDDAISASKKRRPFWLIAIAALMLGALAAILGKTTGIIIGAAVFALGVALSLALAKADKRKKKSAAITLLESITDISEEDEKRYCELLSEMLEYIEIEGEDDSTSCDRIAEFSEKFFTRGTADPLILVRDIISKHDRYKSLRSGQKYRDEAELRRSERGASLASEVAEFLNKFWFESPDPFGELRQKRLEYQSLTDRIISQGREIASLSAMNGIDGDRERREPEERDIEKMIAENALLISRISRDKTLLERQYLQDSEALSGRDILKGEISVLSERLEKYQKNLNTVQLTTKYLTAASEAITAKYIGPTKRSFKEYSALIGAETEAEYEMDTSFGTAKIDLGGTHPTDSYSRGTKDLYRVAARLALIDSLYEGEEPFIILDDPFTSFDDKKLDSALKLLSAIGKRRQIIYFTCASSRLVLDKAVKI